MKTIIAVVSFIIAVGTVIVALDAHYAKAQALQRLELRMDQKILVDRQDKVQERIWRLEDRYKNDIRNANDTDKEQWRKLIEEQKSNEKELDLIKTKSIGSKP